MKINNLPPEIKFAMVKETPISADTVKATITISELHFEVDSIQDAMVQERMAKSQEYARVMNTNRTMLFFDWLQNKLTMHENILIEIKGYPRSGKSTVAISLAKYIVMLIKKILGIAKEFTINNICPNESEYARRVAVAEKNGEAENSVWVVDEQVETHTQVGSYAEMQFLEDMANITAVRCVHTIWIHPPEFVGRNSLVGLETYGKDFKNGLNRCIMYDMQGKGEQGEPIGIVYVPRFSDRVFEEKYLEPKIEQVSHFLSQDMDLRFDQRIGIALALQENEMFVNAQNNQMRTAVARKMMPFWQPETAIKEIVALAKAPKEYLIQLMNMNKSESEQVELVPNGEEMPEEIEEEKEFNSERTG